MLYSVSTYFIWVCFLLHCFCQQLSPGLIPCKIITLQWNGDNFSFLSKMTCDSYFSRIATNRYIISLLFIQQTAFTYFQNMPPRSFDTRQWWSYAMVQRGLQSHLRITARRSCFKHSKCHADMKNEVGPVDNHNIVQPTNLNWLIRITLTTNEICKPLSLLTLCPNMFVLWRDIFHLFVIFLLEHSLMYLPLIYMSICISVYLSVQIYIYIYNDIYI